jgi:hypothetical protein
MTHSEIQTIAEQLITSHKNIGNWKFELGTPEPSPGKPKHWELLVYWFNSDGNPIDGTGVILVDESTHTARFLR